MLSHRLLICGATLACATTALIGPATHASAEPHTSTVASTVMPALGGTSDRNEASVPRTPPVSVTSSTVAPARRSTSTSSESGATALAVLIMIGVFFVILLPACIIQVIVYRRARKDIHDMPNYTGANGPQYGVTGYPQGTEAPGRSWYTGFSPPWSYKHPYTGRQSSPGSFPGNGYGTNPAQGQGYGMPTAQGPAYGTAPNQGPTYGYGTNPAQGQGYGMPTAQGPAYGTAPNQGPTYGYGTQPPGEISQGQNNPGY